MDTFDIGGELTVDRLGFGAMRITGEDIVGEPEDVDAAREVLRRAADLVDLIDTADSYGPGVSERLVGECLAPYDDVAVATKGGLLRNRDGDWLPCGDPDYLRNAVLCSLDRLRTDTIDLYQLHRPDPDVDQLETARDHVEVATVQNRFNVAYREETDVLEACEEYGIGFIPWYPLAAGDLQLTDDEVATLDEAGRE